jgi:hypothetical protein
MVAGCSHENRPELIERYVNLHDSVILQRDRNNRFSRYAVKVLTPSGHHIGFVPEANAKEIAIALDDNIQYEAVFSKILDHNVLIPIVNVDFFKADAKHRKSPSPDEPVNPQISDTQRLLAYQEMATHKTSHILHFFLSVASAGLWLIPWFILSANNTGERNKIRRNYGLPIESDGAGMVIKFLIVTYLIGIFIRGCKGL